MFWLYKYNKRQDFKVSKQHFKQLGKNYEKSPEIFFVWKKPYIVVIECSLCSLLSNIIF
jgi:hypothetical protein